jgi:hypothetical protein
LQNLYHFLLFWLSNMSEYRESGIRLSEAVEYKLKICRHRFDGY